MAIECRRFLVMKINMTKENDYIQTNIEGILQTRITDFKTVARRVILSEIKESSTKL